MLRAAARAALTAPRGPVSVEWPIDLQYLPTPRRRRHARARGRAAVARPGDAVAEAAALLAAAQRPLVWAGGGATQRGAPLRGTRSTRSAPGSLT